MNCRRSAAALLWSTATAALYNTRGARAFTVGSGSRSFNTQTYKHFSSSSMLSAKRPVASLSFVDHATTETTTAANTTVLIGTKQELQDLDSSFYESLNLENNNNIVKALLKTLPAKGGSCASSLVEVLKSDDTSSDYDVHRLTFLALPTNLTRNNHMSHKLTDLVSTAASAKGTSRLVFVMNADDTVDPNVAASAVAKAFPLYDSKTNNGKPKEVSDRHVEVVFCNNNNNKETAKDDNVIGTSSIVADSVRQAARLVDMPPNELTTTRFSEEVKQLVQKHSKTVTMKEIVGRDLKDQGYGGLYGVGQAAECPPRLVILEYTPEQQGNSADDEQDESVALVGKGIVYDTGGLSLKGKNGMPGMKHDMAGAAALLHAFFAAVELQVPRKLWCILCLAENAIGNQAFRNDDILTMYSGKTVEVNNCDAEGRLVLGDGVAHASRHLQPSLIVDMATLTGAQLIATGKRHAGILANTEELEQRAVQAGLQSGDLCYPLLYCPEVLMGEFDSKVADMKNSVKDRGNAQTSCAGHFIEAHLHPDYEGGWLHVDMAGPGTKEQRGTGYGVGLVLSLLGAFSTE